MNAAIIGAGSIGLRHGRNLRQLGIEELLFVDPDNTRRDTAVRELASSSADRLEAVREMRPDFAVVASPNHLHVQQARALADADLPFFVEKPLSHSLDGLPELAERVREKNLPTLVGCNMRFHPAVQRIREELENNRIGALLFGRYRVGSYLPDWRPGVDWRQSYSARPEQGGGCILDCIHELDLAIHLQGPVREVTAVAESLGKLNIEVETWATLSCHHQNGTLSDVHMDYLHRHYDRGFELVGEDGSLVFDDARGTAEFIAPDGSVDALVDVGRDWDYNEMYVREMEHLIRVVRGEEIATLSLPEAMHVTSVALTAREAARTGCRMEVQ